jgi:hypothetical protein
MGIFRPVSLVITNDARIQPFGVHIWNDKSVSKQKRFFIPLQKSRITALHNET